VRFEICDAQTRSFEPEFDLVFARFGTMFFNQPVAAFKNLRRAVAPGGRVLFLTWRSLAENPVFEIPKQIALEVLPPPPDNGVTCGPGPFSQADPDTVREMLGAAGFTEIELERVDAEMPLGDSLEDAMSLQLMLGPAGELVREAGEEGERRLPELKRILAERLAKYQRADGGVWMTSSSWMITARPVV
jgi:SAM-dependent methyltransferase